VRTHSRGAKNSEYPALEELIELAIRQLRMEQFERAWLVQVTPTARAYPQHYIARSQSAADAIEAVKEYWLIGELSKARLEVLGRLSREAAIGLCKFYKLPMGAVLAWPDSKIELLGLESGGTRV
jgi:hypothetical protein